MQITQWLCEGFAIPQKYNKDNILIKKIIICQEIVRKRKVYLTNADRV